MVKYCLNDINSGLPSWWFIFTGAIYFISCIPYKMEAKINGLSIWGFLIKCFSNPYYYLLVLLPLLFIFLLRLHWVPTPLVLSRAGTFSRYVNARYLTLLFPLAIIIIYHFILTILFGWGLSCRSASLPIMGNSGKLLRVFSNYFNSIPLAVLTALVTYMIGLSFISFLVGAFIMLFHKRTAIICIIGTYIFIYLGVQRGSIWNLEYVFWGNYMLLSNELADHLFPIPLVLMLTGCVCLWYIVGKRWCYSKAW